MRRVLIVGARRGGLGWAVRQMIEVIYERAQAEYTIVTAGVSGEEDLPLNVNPSEMSLSAVTELLADVAPDHVVCTVGVNKPRELYASLPDWYLHHYAVNCVGPMRLLEAWLSVLPTRGGVAGSRHFVAVSSNSAHIARRSSGAYCASKAGLSMALRVRAREVEGDPAVIYGYEPGLIAATPMTEEVRERLAGRSVALTRMPGLPAGMAVHQLAAMIARNVAFGGLELNGCLLRVDAGEQ